MFWDKVAGLYDVFENVYNGKVYRGIGEQVAKEIREEDEVLECACGTGAISVYVARKCKHLTATDFSVKMLKQTVKKCAKYGNVTVRKANIMELKCKDARFDKVVAGNCIHLLDDPHGALAELWRVCKPGGKIILPTYVNVKKNGETGFFVKLFHKAGANFQRQFDYKSYVAFLEEAGYPVESCTLIEGRIPCAVAVIKR